ncbi:MAG TPA: TlpA disulfide reductase family protein [Humisphaera sp.]
MTAHAARRRGRSRFLLVALAAAGAIGVPAARYAWAQPKPADEVAPRPVADIEKELVAARDAVGEAIPGMDALLDDARRATIAPKAIPAMRRMARLLDEYARAEPRAKEPIGHAMLELRAMMALMDDAESADYLSRLSVSRDPFEATNAKAWQVVGRWVRARKDAAAQEKLLDEMRRLAGDQPANPMLAQVAALLADSAATPLIAQSVEQMVATGLTSEMAKELSAQLASKRKLNALVDQPLVIEGATADGGKFSTAQWKGKVVLVDFWATWCPPCRAELPELKKFYAEHHDKGLEIIGVSSDREAGELKAFLAKNPDMPWPHLFEPASPGWHPLTDKFGITSIPTVFVIDRNGVVRTVKGRENYKELVPKLLEEKAK